MKSFIKRLAALAATAAMTASLVSVMPASAATSSTDDATAFLESMGAGWCLGNSLDATGNGNSVSSETSWSNPKTTKAMIEAVHDAGFETIRIPVSWGNHTTGDDYTIDEEWMARVKEIVDWAYEDGMHVILNMHHDNSTTYYYPDSEHKESSIKFLTSVWSQIAEEFKDYDEKLVFETLNEPRLVGTNDEWWIDANNPTTAAKKAAEIINDFNQEIVTTIRSTGSNNANRYLICPGYAASMNGATAYFEMPEDTADNKIIVSVHSYTPYNLCLGSSTDTTSASATQFTESGKAEVKAIFDTMKTNFTDKGIPCIIGEMGISNKDNNAARTAWASYYYTLSNEYNIPCMLWDNNAKNGSDKSENHWHFNRKTCKWGDPDVINAIMDAMGVSETTRSIPADEDIVEKAEQTVSGTSSYTKTYGDDDFTLDAKNDKSDGGTLAYESSDTSVVSVSTSGKVSIEGAGTATITVTALENSTYNEATKTVSITVNAKEITPKIDSIDDQKYTGEAITPKVKVKNGATYLTSSNYDVEYSNNTEVGTATVKVTLKGNYSGSATTTFEIVGDGTSSNTSSTVSTSSTASADSENSSSASGSTTSDTTSGTSNTATSSSSSASTGSSANTSSSDTNPSTGLEATGISLAVIALGLLAVSKKRK